MFFPNKEPQISIEFESKYFHCFLELMIRYFVWLYNLHFHQCCFSSKNIWSERLVEDDGWYFKVQCNTCCRLEGGKALLVGHDESWLVRLLFYCQGYFFSLVLWNNCCCFKIHEFVCYKTKDSTKFSRKIYSACALFPSLIYIF